MCMGGEEGKIVAVLVVTKWKVFDCNGVQMKGMKHGRSLGTCLFASLRMCSLFRMVVLGLSGDEESA